MKLYIVIPALNCLELTKQTIESIKANVPATILLIDNASTDGIPRYGEMMHNQEIGYGNILKYIRNNDRKSVAQSWNQGIRMAFEDPQCEYVAVLNNDIVLHPKTLNHLMAFMDHTGYLMVTGDNVKDRMSVEVLQTLELPNPFTDFDTWKIEGWRAEGPDFSCYMINRETIRVMGWFDENFHNAYCEDWDMHKRFQVAREHIEKHNDQQIPSERVHAKRLSTAPYYHYASQTVARNPEVRQRVAIEHGRNQGYYISKWGAIHDQAMDGVGFKTPFGDATKNWRSW